MILTCIERCKVGLFFLASLSFFLFGFSTSALADGYSLGLTAEGADGARGVAIGGSHAWVVGRTNSSSLTAAANPQSSLAGQKDGFISKINSSGVVVWSTYLGGSANDTINAVRYSGGYVYVTGTTSSTDFPVTSTPSPWPSGKNCFYSVINPSTGSLVYSTVFGTNDDDTGFGIALTPSSGRVCIVSETIAGSSASGTVTMFPAVGGSGSVKSSSLPGPGYAVVSNSQGDMMVVGKYGSTSGFLCTVVVVDPDQDPNLYETMYLDFIGYSVVLNGDTNAWVGGSRVALDTTNIRFQPREGTDSDARVADIQGLAVRNGGGTALTLAPKTPSITTINLPYPVRGIALNNDGGVWITGPDNSSAGYVKRINSDYSVTDLTGVTGNGRGMVKLSNGFVVTGSNNSGSSNSFAEYRP